MRSRFFGGLALLTIASSLAQSSSAESAEWVRLPGLTLELGSRPEELVHAAALCNRAVGAQACTPETFALELRKDKELFVPSFFLERTEVSRADYQSCVRAGACEPSEPSDATGEAGHLPVSGVDYWNAEHYCAFRGRRLPTEEEWERAARGGARRAFPWGSLFHAGRVNGGRFGPERTNTDDGFERWAPVDAFASGRTPEGVLQLSGNVAEWTSSEPDREEYGAGSGLRVVRGGHFADPPWLLRAAARSFVPARAKRPTLGFRCAATDPRAHSRSGR